MRKLFTFLVALVAGIGLCWAQSTTVTWISTDFNELGTIATNDGIQLSDPDVFFVHEREGGYERVIDLRAHDDLTAAFSTTNSDLVFTKIEVSGGWHDDEEPYFTGEGWSDSEDGRVWTGQAATVSFNLWMLTDDTGTSPWTIVFTLASAGPATYTLRLLADPEKGSVALQNPSSDIVVNFDDTYNVPEGAEVTLIATPLEGYEFSGWRVGSIYEMCYYDYCGGDVLSTNDNPLTVTMTADLAYVADFAAAAPQPVVLADCGLGWLNVPEGGVVGTIGHEDEIVLPQVNASLDFILAFQAHTATLRLGSTDESVLAVYGFNNFAVNGVGECDVYVVHDEDAVFAYDSAAFHVTVNPEPQTPVIHDSDDAATIETFLSTNHGTEIAELTIDRPVLNNMYNTLCLPFDMDAAQIAASSLNGVEIYELEEVTVANDELFLGLSDAVNAVVAGRPYIVKYSAASQLDDLDFENVTINNADLDDEAITMNGVTFKGTFTPFVMGIQNGFDTNGGYLFLGQNNVLYWPNTNNPLKPFRAYFYIDLNSGSGNAPLRFGMPARIGRPAYTPTGVENVQSDKVQSTKVIENGQLFILKNGVKYNAQGQVVK